MMWRFVIPSLKISGGILEVLRLGERFRDASGEASLVSMWRSPHPVTTTLPVQDLSQWITRARSAPPQLLILWVRFRRLVKRREPANYVFTHFATLPLVSVVPRERRFYFVQDLEWTFVGRGLARLLRMFILACYRRGTVISANSYLTAALREHGVEVKYETPIWASPAFASDADEPRDIDFVMVLRKGKHKRLDLYRHFLALARKANMRVAVISTEDELIRSVRDEVAVAALRPSIDEMRAIYARTKCFIHLSAHEGFGLPPLEAMGAGCVPLCRNSGGVTTYMRGDLAKLVVPLDVPLEAVFAAATSLIRDAVALGSHRAAARAVFEAGPLIDEKLALPLRLIVGSDAEPRAK